MLILIDVEVVTDEMVPYGFAIPASTYTILLTSVDGTEAVIGGLNAVSVPVNAELVPVNAVPIIHHELAATGAAAFGEMLALV